ncbi:MAG: S49 family peptidase [Candidatus Nitricoxidivorans perseverans]|uniref:S49 family peptidase n=1 Tax=Candidatus Nitricoxidivorans perseverans TaxID=2975601 RepID=A0AA49IYW1_9PROT|nr:MAG: S49 family peptidase [Candidatus Nitricoxidivorans perseverans]
MPESNDPGWERKIIEKLALETLVEQRRRRRWGIFFKLLGFGCLALLFTMLGDWSDTADLVERKRHTALIEITGVIQARGDGSAENVIGALQGAFESKGAAGIILRINSPGGSPVQAGIINDEIRRLRGKHPDKPLYAVVEDICASGGYYVAAAADRIYVDKASIVGSIGVLMDGFGFTGSMDKLGVERRLLTAGENKGFLDPFSPQNAQHKAHAQQMLEEIHQQFIDVVRKGRGKRLRETPEMFSGLMWSGAKSIELGLVDGYGTIDSVARDVIKAEDVRDYTVRQNFAEKFARQFGADMAEGMANAFSRFTLR